MDTDDYGGLGFLREISAVLERRHRITSIRILVIVVFLEHVRRNSQ